MDGVILDTALWRKTAEREPLPWLGVTNVI
jgi:hypothetical protein